MTTYTSEDLEKAIRLETVIRYTQFLAESTADPLVQVLAYYMGQGPCRNQKELAAKIGVSEAAISKRVKSLREKLPQLWAQIHLSHETG